MTDNEILDLAASAGITAVCCNHGGTYRDGVDTLKLFAEKAIEKFLEQSGQYVTNDASREAAIAQARAAERERILSIAKTRYDHEVSAAVHHAGSWQAAHEHHLTRQAAMSDMIHAIRARGEA